MAGIKIVDLPALGRDLAATDLLELSLAGGTGSRKITGQEIINASKLNVGTTPIINGTAGRLLFQSTGNTLQQSSSLSYDIANDRLIVGSTGSSGVIAFPTTTSGFSPIIQSQFGGNNIIFSIGGRNFTLNGGGGITTTFNTTITGSTGSAALIVAQGNSGWTPVADFNGSSGTALRVNTNGNVLIGTTTDAGFKLDVNGSAIIRNTAQVVGSDNENVFTVSWGGSNSVSLGSNTANSPTLRLGSIRITAHPGGSSLSFSNGFLTTVNGGTNTNSPIILAPYVTGTSTGNVVLLSSGARISAHRHNPTSGTLNMVMVGGATANQYMDFSPASGNAEFNQLNILNQINTTGTYSGIVRGLYYNPILTSVTGVDHRAIETTAGNVLFGNGSLTISSSGPTFNMNVLNNSQISAIYMNATDGNPRGGLYTNINTGEVRLIAGTGGYFQTFYSNNAERVRITTSGNVLMGTTTDAGYRLDVNGTARVNGELRAGNLQILTSGNAGGTGQGIVVTGGDTTFQFNGSGGSLAVDMFQFRNWAGTTITAQPINADKSVIRIYGGFLSGNVSNLSGNTLSITPTYNLTGNATIVRGIYYNPTLTSLTNGTHFAFHSTSGRVRFEGLPTSPTGLNAGDLWNDAGTLKIV